MEKLIELLNQYEIDRWMWSVFNIWKFAWEIHYYDNEKDEFVFDNVKLYIISKHYGFIKWLVDNNKIDFIKVIQKKWNWEIDNIMLLIKEREYLELLMLLAISDTPIDDLISYLK